jgi:serine phosphatase RsbU (regulator of sigma subunit)
MRIASERRIPIMTRADGTLRTIEATGTLLGAFDAIEVHDAHARLAHGDTLLVFTDGLEERRDGDVFFSDHMFSSVMRSCVATSGERKRLLVFVARCAMSEPKAFADDVAVRAAHVTSPAT